ncbi:MAG: tripartite tricarboxylate transporter substrate binding protein [Alcaligenaceae bacterium]
MINFSRCIFTAVQALALLGFSGSSLAQTETYPARPVKIIVPFGPGGSADMLARVLGEGLSKELGQSFQIENKAGATGVIGTTEVARAKPDGHTLLLGFDGTLTITPFIQNNVTFNATKDFAPISKLTDVAFVVVVNPSIPVKNIKELVEYSKANPGKLSYASPGVGSTAHMLGEQLRLEGGLDWVHIPYGGSGSGKFIIDVIGGSTPAAVISIAVAASSVREGKVLGIGVPSSQINSALPLVPTFGQAGFERFNVASWFALLAPIGTPDQIIKRLNTDVAKVLATDAFKARMAIAGMDVTPSTPTELSQLIASDLKKWEKVAKRIPKAQ